MKKLLVSILTLFMMLSLAACGGEKPADQNDLCGVWKARVLVSAMGDEKTYADAVVELLPDGTGSYRGRAFTWVYDEANSRIDFVLSQDNTTAAFTVTEEKGETVLKFFQDTYYRVEQ